MLLFNFLQSIKFISNYNFRVPLVIILTQIDQIIVTSTSQVSYILFSVSIHWQLESVLLTNVGLEVHVSNLHLIYINYYYKKKTSKMNLINNSFVLISWNCVAVSRGPYARRVQQNLREIEAPLRLEVPFEIIGQF